MSLNTQTNLTSVNKQTNLTASFLKLNPLRSETIQNSHTKSELDLIYLEDSIILQVKRENQPSETYYGFDSLTAKRIKSAWEWEAEDELMAIAQHPMIHCL
ncbi:MAG: hypothetical protein HC939_24465 [Pleurocapsa sp. SU_5_0]|nr:hypothetical protein [Pleurocapsa sp. SU_5_0]